MKLFAVFLLVAFLICGCFVHGRRRRPAGPPLPGAGVIRFDEWRRAIRLNSQPHYTVDAPRPGYLMEKLRREEARQKPERGRN